MRAPVDALCSAPTAGPSRGGARNRRVAGPGRPVEAADDRATFAKADGRRPPWRRREVYGDARHPARPPARGRKRWHPERLDREIVAALRRRGGPSAAHRRTGAGAVPSRGCGARRAVPRRRRLGAEAVGDDVTYVVNRNINFTNVCYVGCRFCAFAQREMDAESYTLTLDRGRRPCGGSVGARRHGGVHAGRDPSRPAGSFYFDLLDAVKARVRPACTSTRFSPMEVMNGVDETRRLVRRVPRGGEAAGLGNDPRDGRRDPGRRGPLGAHEGQAPRRHVGGDRPHRTRIWASGAPATIMFGHVDAPPALGGPSSGGWRGSRPTPAGSRSSCRCRSSISNAPIYLAGKARPGATSAEHLRMHAVARILLDGLIHNIQVSWVKLGSRCVPDGSCVPGPTISAARSMEETISRMAGAEWGIEMTPDGSTMRSARSVASPVVRTTTYERVERVRARRSRQRRDRYPSTTLTVRILA